MPGRGTAQGRFLIEIDGIPAIRAMEATTPEYKHTPFKLFESNRPNPHVGRGNYEVTEVTVKHGYALNNAGTQFFQWLRDFSKGNNVQRRGCRLIVLDEDGLSPVHTYQLEECVPTSFKPDGFNAGSNDAMSFSFMLQPEDFTEF